jgi:hypothetical protein
MQAKCTGVAWSDIAPRLSCLVPKAWDVDDGDDLKGQHPIVQHTELLAQLWLLLEVLLQHGDMQAESQGDAWVW